MIDRDAIARIPPTPGLRREHIVFTAAGRPRAALVDAWQRVYKVRHRTRVGRNAAEVDIAVLDEAVSLIHAELQYVDAARIWVVVDPGSTNGTFIEGERVRGSAQVKDGQVVLFGDVGFLFVEAR